MGDILRSNNYLMLTPCGLISVNYNAERDSILCPECGIAPPIITMPNDQFALFGCQNEKCHKSIHNIFGISVSLFPPNVSRDESGQITVQRTDTWLVYDGDPESLPWGDGTLVAAESADGKDGHYGELITYGLFAPEVRRGPTKKMWCFQLRKGDLIRAI